MKLPPLFSLSARRWDLLLLVVIVLCSAFYTAGILSVPFHPDESSLIFMSGDWETLLRAPGQLAWQANSSDPRQPMRLLDAPLARYLIGISRSLNGFAPLAVDWNWGLSFAANQQAGALPNPELLTASRLGPAALFPFSLLLIYLTGLKLGGRVLGWLALLLLAGNALVLLHTRRAMAEGGLIFTICLFMAGLVYLNQRPWLLAIPAGLAFCAKHSTLPLAGIGGLAILLACARPFHWQKALRWLAAYGLLLLAIIVPLNPFAWGNPLGSIQAAVAARQELLTRQTQAFTAALPEAALNSPLEVGFSLLVNQFIQPPAVADVGNYQAQTEAAAQAYFSNPLHALLRGLLAGGVLLALSLTGFGLSILRRSQRRTAWVLLALAGSLQFLALSATVTLPFQRYALPVIPFSCLWIGCSLNEMILRLRLAFNPPEPMGQSKLSPPPPSSPL